MYGNKGNFITLVHKSDPDNFGKDVFDSMKKQQLIPTKSFPASPKVHGLDFSDHRNYWKFGFPALMITNTAFYRNQNYHQSTDTMETLDLKRMKLVIDELYLAICELY